MKASAINWPSITLGPHVLVVRWTFYAQWLLSKRGVNVRDLRAAMNAKDPALVNTLVECFAASVAENFKAEGLPVPDAEYWAFIISDEAQKDDGVWLRVNQSIWTAVGKVQPAAVTPAPQQETAAQPVTQ